MPKKKKKVDKYEDFYDRAFDEYDIDEILKEGGSVSLKNFMDSSKDNTKDKGYWDAMFKSGKGILGAEIYKRYFRSEGVTINKRKRFIVKKGNRIDFGGKTYRGGMFVPKALLKRW